MIINDDSLGIKAGRILSFSKANQYVDNHIIIDGYPLIYLLYLTDIQIFHSYKCT